jgi:nucleotide-binding universal stress UspA family protein
MIERILVPMDGTTFSEHALPHAIAVAKRAGASIDLAMVEVPSPLAFPDLGFIQPLKDAELTYLEGVAERVRAAGVEDVSIHVLEGFVPDALESHRTSRGAALTVMSTHGRGPVARSWLGSVADHFARTTRGPVLMVRPDGDDGSEVALDSLPSVERVMVTLDGSDLSEAAIEPALDMARLFGAGLTLVRVIEYPNRTESVYLPDAVEAIEDRLEESRSATQDELARVAARVADGEVPVDQEARVVIHAAEGILDIAGERGADMIVMASHGRGGVRRLLLGSVTDKVLRGSHRPVLVVRSEEA